MAGTLHHVRLELAREPGAPDGDPHTGYDLVAPLTADHQIDPSAVRDVGDRCRVRRFEQEETARVGRLRSKGGGWIFDFAEGDADDEAPFRLGEERLVLGEYVSVRGPDGVQHPYRITQVQPV